MRRARRTRRYVEQRWISLLRPVLTYNESRKAWVLRGIGRRVGPVLRVERRTRTSVQSVDRRHTRVA